MLLAQRIGKTSAGRDIIGIEGSVTRIRPQRVRNQPLAAKSLQIVAHAEIQRKMVGDPDRILDERRILARIWVRHCRTEILLVNAWYLMSIGAQRGQLQPAHLRHKRERIDLDALKKVFTAEQTRKKIARPNPIH